MSRNQAYIDLLVQVLAIPALSREEETRAAFLEKWLKEEGFYIHRVKNNLVISGKPSFEESTVLLNSHIDTVPPGEGWKTDPFLPVKEDGKITGLGSNDAGASAISLIAAYKGLVEKDISGNVVLVLSAEEEVSGKNGISSVLPLLGNLKFAVVGEPTGMEPAVAERGLMVIDAEMMGLAGHAARNEGVNAIYKAMEDIRRIREIRFSDHSEWLADPSVNVTMIQSGTGHNTIPAKCSFVIDVRSNDRYTNERLLEILKNQCKSELNPRSLRLKSSFLDSEHPVYGILKQTGNNMFGSPTLSDMALLDIPAVKIGPGHSSRSHTANEYIFIREIDDAIDAYTELLEKIVNLKL